MAPGDPRLAARPAGLRELALVYALVVVAFGYFVGTWQDGNTWSRLSLVRAIVVEQRFEIDTTQLDDRFAEMRTNDRSIVGGHYYSDKAIGSSLLGALIWAPVHALLQAAGLASDGRTFKVVAPFLAISVPCALLAPLIYGFVIRLAGARVALFATCATVLGTAVFKYSTGFYGHVPAGLCLFAAFLIWFQARRQHALSTVQAFASGALLGFMVVTEFPTAVLALLFGGYMLFVLRELGRLGDWRVYAVTGAGFLLALIPLLYYNAIVFGSPLSTGYQHHATARFAAAHAQGLSGIGAPDPVVMFAMTLHPMMGLAWQSPVLLLAIAGWVRMRRSALRAELWLSLGLIAAYVALISGYYEWSGGLAYTPRHLIPILPLFAVPLAFVPARWLGLAWALALVSIGQHLMAVAGRLDYAVRLMMRVLDGEHHPTTYFVSILWNICWPNLRAGMYLKNRGTLLGLEGAASLLPLFAVEAALVLALWLTLRSQDRAAAGGAA